jgi:hypothetical protein
MLVDQLNQSLRLHKLITMRNDVDVESFNYNFQLNDLMKKQLLKKKIQNKSHHHDLIVQKKLIPHNNNMFHQDVLLKKDVLSLLFIG